MKLAIFDLDNTLLNGDSDHAWGQFLIERNIVAREEYELANLQFYEQYKQGTLNINEFLTFALQPLTRYSLTQLQQWHQAFMTDVIHSMLLPKAQALLKWHRDRGDYLLIITATNRFITAPIAHLLKVDD